MSKRSNQHIKKALELAKQLMCLADNGDMHRRDDSCGVLYAVIRDSAYRIKERAEREKEMHIALGLWQDERNEIDQEGVK